MICNHGLAIAILLSLLGVKRSNPLLKKPSSNRLVGFWASSFILELDAGLGDVQH